MRTLRADVILALFLIAVTLSACGERAEKNTNAKPSNSNSEVSNPAKTNVEELSLLVSVPYETEDIAWKDDPINKKVIAVLRFSPADANKIVADAERLGAPTTVTIPTESWFPGELIAQSEMSGDSTLKGLAYAANDFYQEPYTAGRILRIEGSDYFVLELSAK